MARPTPPPPPLAAVVFLENLGNITGVNLPAWAVRVVDFVAEEYVKIALRVHGVHRHYDRVVILEDSRATGPDLSAALLALSRTHRVDLLILAHGAPGQIVGCNGVRIGNETFGPLLAQKQRDPASLRLRVVWQMNCYGASLANIWLALGAVAVNGSAGVNWLPEPTLSLFLRKWLHGAPFSEAVYASATGAERAWKPIYRSRADAPLHPRLAASRTIVVGEDTSFLG